MVKGLKPERDEPPKCPKCGQAMKFVTSLPPEEDLPGVESFCCAECKEAMAREVE